MFMLKPQTQNLRLIETGDNCVFSCIFFVEYIILYIILKAFYLVKKCDIFFMKDVIFIIFWKELSWQITRDS